MNMEHENILGFYVSVTIGNYDDDQETQDLARRQGDLFRTYIWGEDGIDNVVRKLKRKDYGRDLELILFQFYVNPLTIQLENLKEIERYRKKEKSIGIPVVVTGENFFSKSEATRFAFLKQSIVQKLDVLAKVVTRNKLDTKIGLLKSDLEKCLSDRQ